MKVQLDAMNRLIASLAEQRNVILRELRKECKHLRLVELDASPPRRICADCGAEERGWYCDYHVLVIKGDTWDAPHKNNRALIERVSDISQFVRYRQNGPLYLVGQSHPNFGGGIQTHEQLTVI